MPIHWGCATLSRTALYGGLSPLELTLIAVMSFASWLLEKIRSHSVGVLHTRATLAAFLFRFLPVGCCSPLTE